MKEYQFKIGEVARAMKRHASVLSCGVGFASSRLAKHDWKTLAEIAVMATHLQEGPWRVAEDIGGDRAFLETTHGRDPYDVRLYINGNFRDNLDQLHYGEKLARNLNSPFVADRAWGRTWQDFNAAPWGRQVLLTKRHHNRDGSPDPMWVAEAKRHGEWTFPNGLIPTHWMELPEGPR